MTIRGLTISLSLGAVSLVALCAIMATLAWTFSRSQQHAKPMPNGDEAKPMSNREAIEGDEPVDADSLELELVLENAATTEGEAIVGEIRLINKSAKRLSLVSSGDIRQYLEFRIVDLDGHNWAKPGFGLAYPGNIASQSRHSIQAHSALQRSICLTDYNFHESSLPAGEYTAQAIFSYGNLELSSNPMLLCVRRK